MLVPGPPLTEREYHAVRAIARLHAARGWSPRNVDVAAELGVSRERVRQIVLSLQAKGFVLDRPPGSRSGIALTMRGILASERLTST